MNRRLLPLIALAILLPSVALAANENEPENGFVHGQDIEWSSLHMQTFDSTEHRAFHALWERKERDWLAEHPDHSGTYTDLLRAWTAERNRQHRLWHRNHDQSVQGTEDTMTNAPVPPQDVMDEPGMPLSFSPGSSSVSVSHTYTTRISRRFLRAMVAARRAAERK